MHLNKIVIVSLASAAVLHAGFFSNDKAYYDKHPKEAEEKAKLCEKALVVALQKGDMQLAEKYDKDEECKDARASYKEYLTKKRKAQREAREKQRAQEKAKKEAVFKEVYAKQLAIFKKADYETFMKLGKEDNCAHYFGELFSDDLSPKDAKCKAWREIEPKKKQEKIGLLLKQYPQEKIFEYKEKMCKQYGPSCDLAIKAADQETKNRVADYLAHKDKLKHDFNECYYALDKLAKAGKFNEKIKLQQSYKCNMPAQAALKLNIYGYFNPMK